MPPSLRDWVAEDHLVWTVLAAVAEMDLSALYAAYRPDGHGRPAYEPSLMVALLMYAYSQGNRSSRGIERKCREDVAYRVIAVNLVPDHSTIAEFRARHETALAGLFSEVLSLCRAAGMVNVGVIAVDGTKVHANASNMASPASREVSSSSHWYTNSSGILMDDAAWAIRSSPGARPANPNTAALIRGSAATNGTPMIVPMETPQ